MLKTIFLLFAAIEILGGCKMAQAVNDTPVINGSQPGIEQQIREHAQKVLSLAPDQIAVQELKLNDLPANVRQFYVEQKNTSGAINYTYLYWKNSLYSSGVDADFGRFLKDYNFLAQPDADAKQFLAIFTKLKNFQNVIPIEEKDLSQPDERLKPFLSKISAPKLTKTNDGAATFTLFTRSPNVVPVQKIEVKVAPDYATTFKREFVAL